MCPMCRGRLIRARRRVVDRLRSLFDPVKRYRCVNFACQWHGNVSDRRVERWSSTASAQPQLHSGRKQVKSRVPAAFVLHMMLVVFCVAFVLVFSTVDPVPWISQAAQARNAVIDEPVGPSEGQIE
jgi:hypothetical protein